jgi:ankyrin repeat protein
LRSLKSSLEGTFEQTMKRIKDSNRATVDATNVLTLIYLAERPLTVNELLHALAVEENEEDLDQDNRDDPKTFLDCCLGLATIDVETSTVRFFHLRLREYFAECRQVFNETFEKGHDYIARTCLTYIMFLPLKLDPSLQTGTGSPVSEAQIRLNYPLLDYASCQWGHHLRNSGQKEESVVKLAQRYLSIEPRERYWSQWCLCNLINEGSDVEPSVVSFSKWHIAAYFGIHSVLSDSLIVATELDSKDSYYGKTPLIWSAEYGRQEVVRLLLEQGADVNANDRRKRTALYWAVGNRDEAIVRLLLKHHADVNSRDDGGREVLPRAVWDQQIAIVQLLVEYEADVNARADTGGYRTAEEWSVLHEAAYNGTEKIVELLLKFGASIRAETTKGQTALHMAAKNGHAGAVKQLLLALERKNSSLMRAATDRKNNKGKTPLHQAAKNGQDEVVQLLLRHNVDVSLTDNDGRTALHHAAKCKHWTPKRISWTYENRNKHDAIIRRLLQRKAQITVMDELGYMALHYAAGWGSEAVMRLLLVEHKEDVNVWNGDGDTALHVAAVTGNRDAVPPLLEYMADINVKSKSGSTALDKAELYGRTTVARLLLDQETNINPMRKWEALLRCASNASEAKTKQIIHLMSFNIDGADPTRIGGSYFAWMVLHTAIQSGQTTVIKWLLERMPIVHMPHENLIPLAQAAQRDDMAGFGRLFEELKGDVDALASFGAMYLVSHSLRALYGAAKNGPKAVMQFLQENNTNTEATIEDGERLVAVVEVLLELEKWRDLFREIEQTREAVVGRANQPEGSIVTNLGEDGSSVNVS